MNKEWTNEELDELHSSLHSFLSFVTDESMKIMVETFGENSGQVFGHVKAIKSQINEMLEQHGGRFYKPITLETNGCVEK